MRAYYVLLAAAVALLASSDAVSATTVSKANSIRTSSSNNRLLRIRGDEDGDALTEDSVDEERGMGEVSEKAASTVTKLTEGTSGLNKADDELKALAAQVAEDFKALAAQNAEYFEKVMGLAPRSNPNLEWDVTDSVNLALFKVIKERGTTPREMASQLSIRTKLLSKTAEQLLYDHDYLLWVQYSAWWHDVGNMAR